MFDLIVANHVFVLDITASRRPESIYYRRAGGLHVFYLVVNFIKSRMIPVVEAFDASFTTTEGKNIGNLCPVLLDHDGIPSLYHSQALVHSDTNHYECHWTHSASTIIYGFNF